MFDADALIQSVVNQATSDQNIIVPEGEYIAITDEIKRSNFRVTSSDKDQPNEGGADSHGKKIVLDLFWIVDDPQVRAVTKRDKPTVKQGIFLEVTPGSDIEAGRFSLAGGEGENVGIGRLRTIFNQNDPGRPWSMSQLGGNAARITVVHKKDGENVYANVKKVVKI
jgi:hypothetical protein